MYFLLFLLVISLENVISYQRQYFYNTYQQVPNPPIPKTYHTQSINTQTQPTCGIIKPKITHLIANSKFTNHDSWPWNVQLVIQLNNYERTKVYCGGTILSKSYILTAAHCFDELKPHERAFNTFIIFNSIFIDTKRTVLKLNAESIIENPAYIRNLKDKESTSYRNLQSGPKHDLALVKFNLNNFNEMLKQNIYKQLNKICLPKLNVNLKEGTKCKVLGQGFMSSNDKDNDFLMSRHLQQADIIISTNKQCRSSVDSSFVKEKINADTLCIVGSTHPCLGDSGGSLICSQNNKWYLMGVTSFAVSSSSKDRCGQFKSAVFAKVSNYVNWIKYYVNDY